MQDLSGAERRSGDSSEAFDVTLVLTPRDRLDTRPANSGREPAPASVFNEDALRVAIRDIVRDELQKTLGESLSQRVRRLVRSEVMRLISGREPA